MQTEQSNSQMPVQSSLDVDGGVPYENKVITAMAMQHLLGAPERDRDGREGAGQGEGREHSDLRQPPAPNFVAIFAVEVILVISIIVSHSTGTPGLLTSVDSSIDTNTITTFLV